MRMTRIWLSCVVVSWVVGVSSAQAVPSKRFDQGLQICRELTFYNSGWVSEGAVIFQKNCKECHHRDNNKGAPFLHTESKNMRGWNRVFAERYPKCAKDGFWGALSREQLLLLNDYLYRNAEGTYDANTAESCG